MQNKINNDVSTSAITFSKTRLCDVFSMFYGNDPLRPVMLKPFVIGNRTYATDAYTLICCDSDKIDFEYENNETPLRVDNVIPEINTSEIIDIDAIDWIALMNKDEMIGDGGDVDCGYCNGEGTYYDSISYKNKFYDVEYECPVCDGSGYEQKENMIPTGIKTFGSYDLVKFKETYFYATKFYKLKKVKDLVGGNVELISYNNNNKGVLFRIGFLDVLIMPCMHDSEDHIIANVTCL